MKHQKLIAYCKTVFRYQQRHGINRFSVISDCCRSLVVATCNELLSGEAVYVEMCCECQTELSRDLLA